MAVKMQGVSKLYIYELNGKRGTVVFPDKVTWAEAYRRLVVKFGDSVTLPGYER